MTPAEQIEFDLPPPPWPNYIRCETERTNVCDVVEVSPGVFEGQYVGLPQTRAAGSTFFEALDRASVKLKRLPDGVQWAAAVDHPKGVTPCFLCRECGAVLHPTQGTPHRPTCPTYQAEIARLNALAATWTGVAPVAWSSSPEFLSWIEEVRRNGPVHGIELFRELASAHQGVNQADACALLEWATEHGLIHKVEAQRPHGCAPDMLGGGHIKQADWVATWWTYGVGGAT